METPNHQDQLTESLVSIVNRFDAFTYRCLCDDAYTMLVMSGKVPELTGYQTEDIVNNNRVAFSELIYRDDVKLVDKAVDYGVEHKTNWNVDYRLTKMDGSLLWVNEIGGAVYDDNGELVYLEGLVTDISTRKLEEEKRHNILVELIKQNKDINDQLKKLHFIGISAQIEAARFGDDGAGFAYVAQEIRTMASDTLHIAKSITALIDDFEKEG